MNSLPLASEAPNFLGGLHLGSFLSAPVSVWDFLVFLLNSFLCDLSPAARLAVVIQDLSVQQTVVPGHVALGRWQVCF